MFTGVAAMTSAKLSPCFPCEAGAECAGTTDQGAAPGRRPSPPAPGAVGPRAGIGSGGCPRPATGPAHPRSTDVSPFDRIVIIFNPNSTGDAPRSAEELRAELARRLPAVPVELRPTQHAGHARELAREAAGTGRPLLVSVSGDGGGNEVGAGVVLRGNG